MTSSYNIAASLPSIMCVCCFKYNSASQEKFLNLGSRECRSRSLNGGEAFDPILVLFRSVGRELGICLVSLGTGWTIIFAYVGEWPVRQSICLQTGSSCLGSWEISLAHFIEKDSHLFPGHNFLKFLGFRWLISKIWQWNWFFSLVA